MPGPSFRAERSNLDCSTRANRELVGTLVAAVAEVGPDVIGRDAIERRVERPVRALVSRPTKCPSDIALTFGVELASLDQLERLLPWAWKAERLSTALEA
jgi:hypothetical protein